MAGNDRAASVAVGAVGGSLITYILTKGAKARAAGPPAGMDPEVWNMFLDLMEAMTLQTQSIQDLIASMGGAPATVEGPFDNSPKFITGQVVCTVIGQGFNLPPIPIPKNKQLVIKANPANLGWVVVGVSQADSQNINVAYPLVPNEGIGLFIKNADEAWVMAPPPPFGNLNDGVVFIVEQG